MVACCGYQLRSQSVELQCLLVTLFIDAQTLNLPFSLSDLGHII